MDIRALVMGVSFALMWSSAFATARIIVADAPPLWALTLRFAISGMIAVVAARALGQSWRLPGGWGGAQARTVVVFGLCQNALYLGLNFTAMQTVEASLAAVIASTMPLIVAALGGVLRRETISAGGYLGLVVGFAGVAVIMGSRINLGADVAGIAMCTLAALALAVATLSMRGASGSGNLLMVVGLQMLVGAFVLAGVALLREPLVVRPSLPLLLAFAYQIAVPGLAATLLWFRLVSRLGPVRAASFHFLNPVFGIAVAALLLGERIGWLDVLGVAVVTVGILAVQRARHHGSSR